MNQKQIMPQNIIDCCLKMLHVGFSDVLYNCIFIRRKKHISINSTEFHIPQNSTFNVQIWSVAANDNLRLQMA